ncbi:hypothetical protein LCGC14_0519120 [marine sediment metagenome]|uniref:Uncharacterized protein n=1 Tax=marine sediment metagenome TaxID=412755 RepID=A0A0F9UKE9_9ZZZZ
MTLATDQRPTPRTTKRPASDPVVPISWEYLQFHALLDELRQLRTSIMALVSMFAVLIVVSMIAVVGAFVHWFL